MKHPLSKARIKGYSRMARLIDATEAESIKARGRAIKVEHDHIRAVLRELSQARAKQGLSLEEVGRATKIGKANLSRLENNARANPTLATLIRYARAVNKKIVVQ